MRIINTAIDKIKPYAKNPRINDAAVEHVAKSIQQYGFQQPIVVDKKHVIIVGHTRYLAAKELKLKTVPALVADKLTPKQVKAYRIADNKTHEFSEWDFDLLKGELVGLDDLFTGFGEEFFNIPEFEPSSESDQSSLDEIEPLMCKCPKCGKEFDAKQNKVED